MHVEALCPKAGYFSSVPNGRCNTYNQYALPSSAPSVGYSNAGSFPQSRRVAMSAPSRMALNFSQTTVPGTSVRSCRTRRGSFVVLADQIYRRSFRPVRGRSTRLKRPHEGRQGVTRRHRHPTGPHSCWMLSRSLETLSIRMEKAKWPRSLPYAPRRELSNRPSVRETMHRRGRPGRRQCRTKTSHSNS